jgi:hypothetical protein
MQNKDRDPISMLGIVPILLTQLLLMTAPFDAGGGLSWRLSYLGIGFAASLLAMWLERRLARRSAPVAVRLGVLGGAFFIVGLSAVLIASVSITRVVLLGALALAVAGGMLMGLWAWRGRAVRASQCARCGYETGPIESMPDLCPECGSDWRQPGGITNERFVRRPWIALAGLAVFVGGIAVIMPGATGVLSPILPTGVLISMAANQQFLSDRAWLELESRPLTQEQQISVAAALIDRRRAGLHTGPAPAAWIETIGPTLPRELQHRYFREMADIWLECLPAQGSAPARLRVAGDSHGYRGRTAYFAIGALEVDGLEAQPPRPALVHALQLHRDFPPLDYAVPAQRPLDVRLRVWLVVGSWNYFGTAQPVRWSDEGEPLLPPGADWIHEIELKLRITDP